MKTCGTILGVLGLVAVIALPGGYEADMITAGWLVAGEAAALALAWLGAKLTKVGAVDE